MHRLIIPLALVALAVMPAVSQAQGLPAPNLTPLVVPTQIAWYEAAEKRLKDLLQVSIVRLKNPNNPEIVKLREEIEKLRKIRERLQGG
jgi:hypothetical protein